MFLLDMIDMSYFQDLVYIFLDYMLHMYFPSFHIRHYMLILYTSYLMYYVNSKLWKTMHLHQQRLNKKYNSFVTHYQY